MHRRKRSWTAECPQDAQHAHWRWVREQTEHILERGTNDGVAVSGRSIILVTTKAAKSGKRRYVAVMRVDKDGSYAMVDSKGDAPEHPSWYAN